LKAEKSRIKKTSFLAAKMFFDGLARQMQNAFTVNKVAHPSFLTSRHWGH
jgi:hypothetical protein